MTRVHFISAPARPGNWAVPEDTPALCGATGWAAASIRWEDVDCKQCLKRKPEEAVAR